MGHVLSITCAIAFALPASAQTQTVSLFNGELSLDLPSTAGAAKKLTANLYSIQPKAKKQKIVVYATKEPVLADESALTDAQLASSIKALLEAQGYTVESLKNRKNTFSARISTIGTVPWRKLGTASAKGLAQFTRTSKGQLLGAVVLSDPSQWNKGPTKAYRSAVLKVHTSN